MADINDDSGGYTSPTSSKFGTLATPTDLRDPTPSPPLEPHYDYIPAQLGSEVGGAATTTVGGDYYHLLDRAPPSPPPKAPPMTLDKSGQYGRLYENNENGENNENKGRARGNPYVSIPVGEGGRPREMYTLLPSPEQLKKMAADSESSEL